MKFGLKYTLLALTLLAACEEVETPLVTEKVYFLRGLDPDAYTVILQGEFFNDSPRIIRDPKVLASFHDSVYYVRSNAGAHKTKGLITGTIYTNETGYGPLLTIVKDGKIANERRCHVSECGRTKFFGLLDAKPKELRALYRQGEGIEAQTKVFESQEDAERFVGSLDYYAGMLNPNQYQSDINPINNRTAVSIELPSQLVMLSDVDICAPDFEQKWREKALDQLDLDALPFLVEVNDVEIRREDIVDIRDTNADDFDCSTPTGDAAIVDVIVKAEVASTFYPELATYISRHEATDYDPDAISDYLNPDDTTPRVWFPYQRGQVDIDTADRYHVVEWYALVG